jgi:hypothetical protein
MVFLHTVQDALRLLVQWVHKFVKCVVSCRAKICMVISLSTPIEHKYLDYSLPLATTLLFWRVFVCRCCPCWASGNEFLEVDFLCGS